MHAFLMGGSKQRVHSGAPGQLTDQEGEGRMRMDSQKVQRPWPSTLVAWNVSSHLVLIFLQVHLLLTRERKRMDPGAAPPCSAKLS